jgi:2,3,4,5-tetrahydropyridine-2-carboxylate N-succinyltransferase
VSAGLRERIERLSAAGGAVAVSDAQEAFAELVAALEQGSVRAAEPVDGGWRVNAWVKQGILLGFRVGQVVETDAA